MSNNLNELLKSLDELCDELNNVFKCESSLVEALSQAGRSQADCIKDFQTNVAQLVGAIQDTTKVIRAELLDKKCS